MISCWSGVENRLNDHLYTIRRKKSQNKWQNSLIWPCFCGFWMEILNLDIFKWFLEENSESCHIWPVLTCLSCFPPNIARFSFCENFVASHFWPHGKAFSLLSNLEYDNQSTSDKYCSTHSQCINSLVFHLRRPCNSLSINSSSSNNSFSSSRTFSSGTMGQSWSCSMTTRYAQKTFIQSNNIRTRIL